MTRISKDEWALQLALVTAQRGTCIRRKVGCVLLNVRGHVLATGYNGVAAGLPHCNYMETMEVCGFCGTPMKEATNLCFGCDYVHLTPETVEVREAKPHACDGADAGSGTKLDLCQAIHAEQNALLQCHDVYAIETACVTVSPCITCTKLLLNTSCQRIIYIEEYPHYDARELWLSAGRLWTQVDVL